MAQGLLGGVLPAIYSGADQLKRGVYGLLTNPQEQAERAAQSLLQSRAERQALMARTFANPERPFQVTDQAGLSQLTDQVMSGELGFAPAGITAFHGTPHLIKGKFDASKIGTGEGNQSYGYGMYFAESPAVAQSYKQDFIQSDKTIQALQKFRDDYPVNSPDWNHYDNLMNRNKEGNLYKVDIPDEYIPKMLDWDKPLTEQPKQVQEALKKLGIETDINKLNEYDDALLKSLFEDSNTVLPKQPINPTGEDIYQRIIQGNPKYTAEKLKEVGITGIRYLDQGSRNAITPEIQYYEAGVKKLSDIYQNNPTEANKFALDDAMQKLESVKKGLKDITSNFVVFDPTDVKILERNNKPVEGLLD
jgi:hypothetical protein